MRSQNGLPYIEVAVRPDERTATPPLLPNNGEVGRSGIVPTAGSETSSAPKSLPKRELPHTSYARSQQARSVSADRAEGAASTPSVHPPTAGGSSLRTVVSRWPEGL